MRQRLARSFMMSSASVRQRGYHRRDHGAQPIMLTAAQRDESLPAIFSRRAAHGNRARVCRNACSPDRALEDALRHPAARPGAARSRDRRLEMLAADPRARNFMCCALRPHHCARAIALPRDRSHAGIARIEPEIAFVAWRAPCPRAQCRTPRLKYARPSARPGWCWSCSIRATPDPAGSRFPELLADQVSNQGALRRPGPAGRHEPEPRAFRIAIDGPQGRLHSRDGRHPDGHPLRPLFWLANFLASSAGVEDSTPVKSLTTGSYAGALEVPTGVPLSVRFGGLGKIAVTLLAA